MNILKSGGILHFLQNLYRRWKNGAGCCDIYSLDYYLAKKILRPLKAYKKHQRGGHPADLTEEEWEATLDEMIWAFNHIVNDDMEYEINEREQKGLNMFSKHFGSLWI